MSIGKVSFLQGQNNF